MTTRNTQPVTTESLREDRERREREREKYADELEAAADFLEDRQIRPSEFRTAIRTLRSEASSWRR